MHCTDDQPMATEFQLAPSISPSRNEKAWNNAFRYTEDIFVKNISKLIKDGESAFVLMNDEKFNYNAVAFFNSIEQLQEYWCNASRNQRSFHIGRNYWINEYIIRNNKFVLVKKYMPKHSDLMNDENSDDDMMREIIDGIKKFKIENDTMVV